MLCSMHSEDGKLIDAIAFSEEMEIFSTDLIIDLIEFRWTMFAKAVHIRGFYFHIAYIFCLFIFVGRAYLNHEFYGMPTYVI